MDECPWVVFGSSLSKHTWDLKSYASSGQCHVQSDCKMQAKLEH